jgi:hypothetical protein
MAATDAAADHERERDAGRSDGHPAEVAESEVGRRGPENRPRGAEPSQEPGDDETEEEWCEESRDGGQPDLALGRVGVGDHGLRHVPPLFPLL